jgi:protein-disulfide isomerase
MSKLKPPVSGKDQSTGNPDATVTLVEFGDYQCPHCGHAHPLIKRLLKEKGKDILFVFRNFPLQEAHPAAFMAALAAEAAGQQDKFWPMHDIIFENQQILGGHSFVDFATTLKLDLHRFAADWKSDAMVKKVEGDFESGIRSGVNGTPTFYLNGEMVAYDATYGSLLNAVEMAL